MAVEDGGEENEQVHKAGYYPNRGGRGCGVHQTPVYDMFGTLKNVAITSSQLEKALNNECMFDGSSIEGFVRIEESDMYLYPDLDTFVIFPWRPQQGKSCQNHL